MKLPVEHVSLKQLNREDLLLLKHFDAINQLILRFFYDTGLEFPNDATCYSTQELRGKLINEKELSVKLETLRKRLENLVKFGLLEKIDTWPKIYQPVKDIDGIRERIDRIKSFLDK